MSHFTYDSHLDKDNLYQGDLISRSDAIEDVLNKFHPHFYSNKKNIYFTILTQSCDLVVRPGEKLKTPYITLCAVRTLKDVIEKNIKQQHLSDFEEHFNVLPEKTRVKLRQFVARLLNNNESKYFFFGRDLDSGLADDYCAFLELTIPLKSEEHYKKLLGAKFLQLTHSFQHKLGYLVGNNYARIGTEDWVTKTLTKESFELKIDQILNKSDFISLPDDLHKELKRKFKGQDLSEISQSTFDTILVETKRYLHTKRAAHSSIIKDVLLSSGIDPSTTEKILKRLENNPIFRAAIKS